MYRSNPRPRDKAELLYFSSTANNEMQMRVFLAFNKGKKITDMDAAVILWEK